MIQMWYKKRPKSRSVRQGSRGLFFQTLESRQVMTAEGTLVSIDQVVDTSALLGSVSATANWGDGTSSSLSITNQSSTGPLKARIDYSLDARGFFNPPERRQVLQLAADSLVSKFSDTLSAIQPSGSNTWRAGVLNPSSGASQQFSNITIAANEILIYAGARDLPGNQLGEGGAGNTSSSGPADAAGQAWRDLVRSRGQTGALSSTPTDFGNWGGYIAFDDQVSWHFGTDTTGLDSNESDFYSVALHELTHLMGFGVAPSWSRFVQGTNYVGPNSMAAYDAGGAVPLAGDLSHWKDGITDSGRETLMDPSISVGTRKLLTGLDLAALADIGWQLITPSVRVTGSHIYGDDGVFLVGMNLSGSQIGTVQIGLSQTITNVAPTLNDRTTISIGAGVPLSIVDLGIFSDPGFDVPTATPPTTERFRYSIDWGDGTPADVGDATIDQVGSPNVLTRGSFDGSHTYANVGSFNVQYSVVDDNGGSVAKSFNVQVTAPPSLTISIDKNAIAENAGTNAATLTVRRTGFDTSQPTIVTLSSSDPTEVRLPVSVTILAGGTEAIVAVEAVDDTLLDGTILVSLAASVGSVQASAPIQVTDYETLQLLLSVNRVAENAGSSAAKLTVIRSNTDNGNPLRVTLGSSDPSEATVPDSATIPASAGSTIVDVQAIDDNLIDGLQQVRFNAQSAGYVEANVTLEVEDFEPISLSVNLTSLTEDASNRRAIGQVSILGDAPAGGVLVALNPSQAGQLVLPSSLLIPAGSRSIQFDLLARDDFIVEGPHSVQLSASATGLVPAAVDIAITDNDLPLWQNPTKTFDVDGNGFISPLDALLIINLLNLRGIGELVPGDLPIPPYIDPSGNGILEPSDVLLVLNYLNLNGIG